MWDDTSNMYKEGAEGYPSSEEVEVLQCAKTLYVIALIGPSMPHPWNHLPRCNDNLPRQELAIA
jgi:hypothetical protein